MSRTIRSKIPLKRSCPFRKPRHARALRYSKDEYGIRPKAIPPSDYDDLPYACYNEDYSQKKENKRHLRDIISMTFSIF